MDLKYNGQFNIDEREKILLGNIPHRDRIRWILAYVMSLLWHLAGGRMPAYSGCWPNYAQKFRRWPIPIHF